MLVDAPPQSHADYLALDGIVVSGHVGRNVTRVQLGEHTAYLKREHRVRWRDRWRQWCAGFGAVSLARREAMILEMLANLGFPAPRVLACGEANGQAYLLLEAVPDVVELREWSAVPVTVGRELGKAFAKLHAAGIDQPDLYAKHILINPETAQWVMIDWQRATLRRTVTLEQRLHALANLQATAVDEPAPWWDALLTAYHHEARIPLVLPAFKQRVNLTARHRRDWPAIRKQRQAQSIEQPLVRIQGETVCAIPAVAADFRMATMIADVYDPANAGQPVVVGGQRGRLWNNRYRCYGSRLLTLLRGKEWRAPELQAARVLFHLERCGVAASGLLAYGQRSSWSHIEAFVLYDDGAATVPSRAQALAFVAGLHHANVLLLRPSALGVRDGHTMVIDPRGVRLVRRLSARQKDANRRQCEQWFEEQAS